MKPGKIPENVLVRTVLKQINVNSDESCSAGVGEDCAVFSYLGEDKVYSATNSVCGAFKGAGTWAVFGAVNNIFVKGGECIGLSLSIIVPERFSEEKLKKLMEEIRLAARAAGVVVGGGHTEVSLAVMAPVITVTAIGRPLEGVCVRKAEAGDDIVMTKTAGLLGTFLLANAKREKLLERLPGSFVDNAAVPCGKFSVAAEAKVALLSGPVAMHDVSRGGILACLWEMAQRAGTGLTVNLKKIPITQETVEICDILDHNPYEIISQGSLLIGTKEGYNLAQRLRAEGIPAEVIGTFNDSNDRIVTNGEEERFLTPLKREEVLSLDESFG